MEIEELSNSKILREINFDKINERTYSLTFHVKSEWQEKLLDLQTLEIVKYKNKENNNLTRHWKPSRPLWTSDQVGKKGWGNRFSKTAPSTLTPDFTTPIHVTFLCHFPPDLLQGVTFLSFWLAYQTLKSLIMILSKTLHSVAMSELFWTQILREITAGRIRNSESLSCQNSNWPFLIRLIYKNSFHVCKWRTNS